MSMDKKKHTCEACKARDEGTGSEVLGTCVGCGVATGSSHGRFTTEAGEVCGDCHKKKAVACEYCDRGFPKTKGMHYGTQALGMIPSAPCPRDPQPPATPQLKKLKEVAKFSQKICEFLDWLEEEREIRLARKSDETDYDVVLESNEKLLAEFFAIDLVKVEKERRSLLNYQRVMNGIEPEPEE